MKVLNSYEKRKEGQNDGTVYCNRDELCRLQFQSGKGGIKGRRRHLLFGKLAVLEVQEPLGMRKSC